MTPLVFDLDGTLVDTRDAVRHAYAACGVAMPDWAWGLSWQEWLPALVKSDAVAQELHTRKNRYYGQIMHDHVRALPLLPFAQQLHAPILTGASKEAVTHLLARWPTLHIVETGLTVPGKIHWLNARDPGHYVDDNAVTRHHVERHTKWTALTPEDALIRCRQLTYLR